ncbi:hypothetical protein K3495_g11236 [Podosphaera aphanis]|nr:hypothetical protein K3495_g11236 [Podosphaera aphanis]
MELWVAGFNAWGQLDPPGAPRANPRDIPTFHKSWDDELIQVLWIGDSATVVQTSRGVQCAGHSDEIGEMVCRGATLGASIAVAGNGKVAVLQNGALKLFESLQQWKANQSHEPNIPEFISSVVANQTSFTALSSTGQTWTWGDERYPSCLGRNISHKNPATIPDVIEDLESLPTGPIKKISSGGYATAALNQGNDLYVWGGRPGQPNLIKDLTADPNPVDLQGADFLDIAVGNDHMLAITTDQKLFVVGSGSNGQLGIDSKQLSDWHEVSLNLREGQRLSKVYAGYKTSFILLE